MPCFKYYKYGQDVTVVITSRNSFSPAPLNTR